MEIKLLEIRDRQTFIPAMAIRVTGDVAGDWLPQARRALVAAE
jgi:hypothetical protein